MTRFSRTKICGQVLIRSKLKLSSRGSSVSPRAGDKFIDALAFRYSHTEQQQYQQLRLDFIQERKDCVTEIIFYL